MQKYYIINQGLADSLCTTVAEDRILDASVCFCFGGISVWNFPAVGWKETRTSATAEAFILGSYSVHNKGSGFIQN